MSPKAGAECSVLGVWMLSQEMPPPHTLAFVFSTTNIKVVEVCQSPYKLCRQNLVQNQFLPFSLGMSVSVEGDRP